MNHKPTVTGLPGQSGITHHIKVPLPVRPTLSVESVLLLAASVIAERGLHHEDYVEDPLNKRLDPSFPLTLRAMSVVGAIRYAATGDPQHSSQLSETTVGFLALSLDGGPFWTDWRSLERHVEDWSDGMTAVEAVALLERVATSPEERAA
ncbi:DUF6197 family protein [Streptomyces sp. H27-H5]|uniref:DUF6197 family protein n=1 Tax=Streptomyces sp. H27-H5 TaxID=2996460 RepID=UPI00226E6135|nr:hypothetical protein [Streptomyces sp. H27-H5]MCY0960808.1 hypothetical protein [Streptomyces sp. H27-H5]